MALIDLFDFENYATSGDVVTKMTADKWHGGAFVTVESTTVRTGTRAVQFGTGGGFLQYRTPQDQTEFGVGLGWYIDNGTPMVETLFYFEYNDGAAANEQITIGRDTNNSVVVKRGSTTLATSAISAFTLLNYHFWEIKVLCHASAGSVIVRIDDAEVINISGIDTQEHGSSDVINQFEMRRGGATHYLDDFVIWVTTGSVNNDFLGGETRCFALDGATAGDNAEWTATGAASNHEAVDEDIPDDDTTYNTTNVSGEIDLFNMGNLPPGVVSIYGVKTTAYCRRTEGGTADIKVLQKLSSTTAKSAGINLDTTYKRKSFISETKPTGGSWTPSDVDASQHGYELV